MALPGVVAMVHLARHLEAEVTVRRVLHLAVEATVLPVLHLAAEAMVLPVLHLAAEAMVHPARHLEAEVMVRRVLHLAAEATVLRAHLPGVMVLPLVAHLATVRPEVAMVLPAGVRRLGVASRLRHTNQAHHLPVAAQASKPARQSLSAGKR